MKTVLTIAGSDSSGGAGIQADLKTMEAYGCYGMSVITAVTAQNTRQVLAVQKLQARVVEQQLQAVLSDITPQAVKIGMVYTAENVEAIAWALRRWRHGPVVLDPVLVSTSGHPLLEPEAAEAMERILFPLTDVLTPNLPEAEQLLRGSRRVETRQILQDSRRAETEQILQDSRSMETGGHTGDGGELGAGQLWTDEKMGHMAALLSARYGTVVLLKGGHRAEDASDVLCEGGKLTWFWGERISDRRGSHGTGCTLSTAIACGLAQGKTLREAVEEARAYLTGALENAPGLGGGNGPLCHGWKSLKRNRWEQRKQIGT